MTEEDVLSVIMARMGTSTGITTIAEELKNVLLDISSRADFLTAEDQQATVADQAEYSQPTGLKRIYDCYVDDVGVLEKKTYGDYLKDTKNSFASSGEPINYTIRHGNIYFWLVPDAVYTIDIDYSLYHPETFTNISFGAEFNEAIYEGVITALYQGQLFEKLRLDKKTINGDNLDETVSDGTDTTTTDQDLAGTSLEYKFSSDFPEIRKHKQAYEAEIGKLIKNLDIDTETVLVEYRDI